MKTNGKHKNGASGKKRKNFSGTVEFRKDRGQWRVRFYIYVDGVRQCKTQTITPEVVVETFAARKQYADRLLHAFKLPGGSTLTVDFVNQYENGNAEHKGKPLPRAVALVVLDHLSGGNGIFTQESELTKLKVRLEGIQAQKALQAEALQKERDKQAAVEAEQRAIRLADAWPLYVASKKRPDSGERTLEGYRGQFKLFNQWVADKHPAIQKIRDFTASMAEEFLEHLEATRSQSTRNKYLIFLRTFWQVLKHNPDAQITSDPWDSIKSLVISDEVTHNKFSVEQLRSIAHVLQHSETVQAFAFNGKPVAQELLGCFLVGADTGLRLGDCACWEWDGELSRIDLKSNLTDVMPRKTARKYKRHTILPLHPELRAFLLTLPKEQRKGPVFPTLEEIYLHHEPSIITKWFQQAFREAGIDTGESHKKPKLYFRKTPTGGSYRIQYPEIGNDGKHHTEDTGLTDLNEARIYLAKKTGIQPTKARAVYGTHSLRHTVASTLLNNGVPYALVAKILAHASESMTFHYFHENFDALTDAINKLPWIASDPPATVEPPAALTRIKELWGTLNEEERNAMLGYIAMPSINRTSA